MKKFTIIILTFLVLGLKTAAQFNGRICKIVNMKSGRVLDGDRVSDMNRYVNGTKVTIWDDNFPPNQRWRFREESYGIYTISNEANGRMLDAEDAMGNNFNRNGTKIQLYEANGTKNQKWKITQISSGVYKIQCVANWRALDADFYTINQNGTKVQLWEDNGSEVQHWRIIAL